MTASAGTVIVGASIGGLSTAEALRAGGFDGPITLIGEELQHPYSRPPLSKQLLHEGFEQAGPLTDEPRLRDLGIRFLPGVRIMSADLIQRTVTAGTGEVFPYSTLVAATGARAQRLSAVPDGLTLRTADDAAAIHRALSGSPRVAILGGGVLALELASAARSRALTTTVVARGPSLTLGASGELLSQRLLSLAHDAGVDVRLNTAVVSASGDRLTLNTGEMLNADVVLVAIGASPQTEWLDGNGVDLSDGVLCDERGRFASGAYAVGDVARWADRAGSAHRHQHQSSAISQAQIVAAAICDGPGVLSTPPYFWSDMFGVRIQVGGEVSAPGIVRSVVAGDGDASFVWALSEGPIVRGIIGWNRPRDFRRALSLVGQPLTLDRDDLDSFTA